MLNSIVLAAALLLGGSSVPAPKMFVEPQAIVAPYLDQSMEMTSSIETMLIEQYAAPHWNISIDLAWYYYRDLHTLKIIEVVRDHVFVLKLNDGILEVLIDDAN